MCHFLDDLSACDKYEVRPDGRRVWDPCTWHRVSKSQVRARISKTRPRRPDRHVVRGQATTVIGGLLLVSLFATTPTASNLHVESTRRGSGREWNPHESERVDNEHTSCKAPATRSCLSPTSYHSSFESCSWSIAFTLNVKPVRNHLGIK